MFFKYDLTTYFYIENFCLLQFGRRKKKISFGLVLDAVTWRFVYVFEGRQKKSKAPCTFAFSQNCDCDVLILPLIFCDSVRLPLRHVYVVCLCVCACRASECVMILDSSCNVYVAY